MMQAAPNGGGRITAEIGKAVKPSRASRFRTGHFPGTGFRGLVYLLFTFSLRPACVIVEECR